MSSYFGNYFGDAGTGGASTDPGAGNVRAAVAYAIAGVDFTGTLEVPAEADVLGGVQYGAGGTEFEGTLSQTVVQTQLVVNYPRVVR